MKENAQYAGFWKRFLALVVDFFIVFVALDLLYRVPLNPPFAVFLALLDAALYAFYCAFMIGFLGQTIGMMVVKIKVKKLNLKDVEWKQAFLRYVVNFLQAIIVFGFMTYFILNAAGSDFPAKDFGHFIVELEHAHSPLNTIVVLNVFVTWIWTYSEVVVLMTNEKKRAIHDFIAGTVVVKVSK